MTILKSAWGSWLLLQQDQLTCPSNVKLLSIVIPFLGLEKVLHKPLKNILLLPPHNPCHSCREYGQQQN